MTDLQVSCMLHRMCAAPRTFSTSDTAAALATDRPPRMPAASNSSTPPSRPPRVCRRVVADVATGFSCLAEAVWRQQWAGLLLTAVCATQGRALASMRPSRHGRADMHSVIVAARDPRTATASYQIAWLSSTRND
jgi:hypothetical protein